MAADSECENPSSFENCCPGFHDLDNTEHEISHTAIGETINDQKPGNCASVNHSNRSRKRGQYKLYFAPSGSNSVVVPRTT